MESEETFDWPDEWERAIPAVTRLVISYYRRRGLPESDAEDMLQTLLMRVVIEATARKRHFDSIPLLCGWVRRVLVSLLTKHIKRQSKEKVTAGVDVATLPGGADGPTDTEDIAVYIALLEDTREQEVLTLRYVEGMTLEAIGERLGFSTAQAHKLRDRALEKLRRRLST
jgi:RNA polymerase sigma factor (sigma-70 family)